jgi:Kef-type K+ transport system membrane component KefB
LGILAQTRARGPLAQYTLGFVMSSDVVVASLMALVVSMVRPLVESGAEISMRDMQALGQELLGSVALGTSLGLVLIIYLRLVGRGILIVLLALGFVASDALRYIHFDPVLTFLSAGFVVQNLSAQGDKMLHAIEEAGSSVFVVFFATAGAHLKLDLLRTLWPVALALCVARAALTWTAQQTASRWAHDPPVVRKLGSLPLISQAGLTLGMGVIVERAFPSFGADFRALVVATVAINELVGPVLFKLALDAAGETHREA